MLTLALSRLPPWLRLGELPPEDVLHIKQLAALRQWHVIDTPPPSASASLAASGELLLDSLAPLLESMRSAESFYDILGGVVGYQLTALELIQEAEGKAAQEQYGVAAAESPSCSFLVPRGHDLTADPDFALRAAAAGLAALPRLAELYPLGGAGDRLGLVDEATGAPLPVALLPYGGHTLLAWLLRDLAAREYLHFRLYGAQVRTPVAVMTSQAKGNHSRVKALCEQHAWFGRGEDGFRLFQQPLVPVVAARTGRWLLSAPGRVQLKPGGHGAVWKLAADTGVLDWLESRGVQAVLVRQISNPLAATDTSLLALAGIGASVSRAFGFMSCERAVGAAEGMNVLVERRIAGATPRGTTEAWEYNVSNLEYTEFGRLGVEDVPREGSCASAFPANTNVLYVALSAIRAALGRGVQGALPGMLINLTKPVVAFGEPAPVQAGRLECSMQNLADALPQRFAARLPPDRWADLSTFCVFALRRRVTSSAKRRRLPGDSRLAQTPEGSFLDLLRNGRDMLALGGVSCPEVVSNDAFLREGRPGFLLRHHPALGPLWHVAAQKVRDSRLHQGSELELELAEADVRCLELTGSLLVRALQPLGPSTSAVEACPPVVHYSTTRVGRARLHGVRVANRGVEWEHPENVLWAARVARREAVTVIIHGCVGMYQYTKCVLTLVAALQRRRV